MRHVTAATKAAGPGGGQLSEMDMKTQYRGFDITLTGGDRWWARIARAGADKAWSAGPTASIEEGPEACLAQARNLVDAYLALNGR